MEITELRNALETGVPVEYTAHCQKRMLERDISRKNVTDYILYGEIIEDYPLDGQNKKGEMIIPCLECPICRETTFSDEVSSKLETLVNSAKKILQEISIIDYRKIA